MNAFKTHEQWSQAIERTERVAHYLRSFQVTDTPAAAEMVEHMTHIAEMARRFEVSLDWQGNTGPGGCMECQKSMHYTELLRLEQAGYNTEDCHECQCGGVCPHCEGLGYIVTERLDVDFFREIRCDNCAGHGTYKAYMRGKDGWIEPKSNIER